MDFKFDTLKEQRPPNKAKTIGYATKAVWNGAFAEIYHHDNLIAEIYKDMVKLHRAGWDSDTTSNRLHQIVRANYPYKPEVGDIYSVGKVSGKIGLHVNSLFIRFDSITIGRKGMLNARAGSN